MRQVGVSVSESELDMDPTQVGVQLRHARERRGLEVDEAADATGVSATRIRVLEGEGDPAGWAADSRMLAALRVYARQLGLESEPMVRAAWRAASEQWKPPAARVAPLLPGPAYPHRQPGRRRQLFAGLAVVAVLLVGAGAVVADMVNDDEPAGTDADDSTEEAGGSPTDPESEPTPDGEADAGTPEEVTAEDGAPAADATDDDLPGRPPQDTPVQVLNAREDEAVTAQAVDGLEALGYDVVLVDETLQVWPRSQVLYNPGWETEAESLNARDERFSVGGANNDVFVDEAGLHVVVGSDWAE
jgi:cytoskeletal protein RodZ